MAAFDRIRCGFPELDEILDYIRLGDNVVWQVTDIGEFSMFARPFVRQAVEDGRDVTYVRFAQHDPLIEDLTGVHLLELNPDIGFEAFTVALYEEITHRGREAIYVFDCLSELQSVWYTDLMMGNFFCVICPYLFELDTVAYFLFCGEGIPSMRLPVSAIPRSFCWMSARTKTMFIFVP